MDGGIVSRSGGGWQITYPWHDSCPGLTTAQCPWAEPRPWARGRVGLSDRVTPSSPQSLPFIWGIHGLFLASILSLDLFFIMALIECLFCKYIGTEATPR